MTYPKSTKLGPSNDSACPNCGNSLQNGIPEGSPDLRRCATCKTVFQMNEFEGNYDAWYKNEMNARTPAISSPSSKNLLSSSILLACIAKELVNDDSEVSETNILNLLTQNGYLQLSSLNPSKSVPMYELTEKSQKYLGLLAKTFTIDEVITGLANYKSYKCACGDHTQYVRPSRDGKEFRHDVCGSGWGGSNNMSVSLLVKVKNRWPQTGWEELNEQDKENLSRYPVE